MGIKLPFESVQPFKVVKVIDMLINEVQRPLNNWVTGMLTNSGKTAQSEG